MSARMKPVAKCWMAVLVAMGLGALPAHGAPGDLLHTLLDPTPAVEEYFGRSVAGVGNNVLVGAPDSYPDGSQREAAYLFHGTTGALLKTFQNPTPALQESFGLSVAGVGNDVLVGAPWNNTGAAAAGAAYLFDGTTGALLHTFLNPTPGPLDLFGYSVAGVGNNALVAAPYHRTGVGDKGVAYLLDGTTGALLHRLVNPNPANSGYFGWSVAGVGDNVLVGAPGHYTSANDRGGAYLFDGTTGALLKTFQSPMPIPRNRFGYSVAGVGNNVLVGAVRHVTGGYDGGAAYLFDGTTGALLHTFLSPNPAIGDYFARSVAGVGNNVLVADSVDRTGANDGGAAYLFDGTTGVLLHTFLNPTPAGGDHFGCSVAAVGNNVLVGATGDDTGGTNAGAAYLFEGVGGPPPEHVIDGVPDYKWNYGCSPTAGAMLIGYWDSKDEFAGLVDGDMPLEDHGRRSGAAFDQGPDRDGDDWMGIDWDQGMNDAAVNRPDRSGPRDPDMDNADDWNIVDKVTASAGHIRDYWWAKRDALEAGVYTAPSGEAKDPYEEFGWPEHHPQDCLADMMGTSRGGQEDGGTDPREVPTGLKDFADSRGYSFAAGNIWVSDGDLTFEALMDEISGPGRPMHVGVHLAGGGHSIVVYGYQNNPGTDDDWVALRDTWLDGDSDGTNGIVAKMEGGLEWWRWITDDAQDYFIYRACLFRPYGATEAGATLAHSTFSTPRDFEEAFVVEDGLGDGVAEIACSPLDPEEPVLRLESTQPGSFVAIVREISVTERIGISLDYLFDTDGKIRVELDGLLLSELACPLFGPGSVGADSFGFFSEVFSMYAIGLDPTEMHTLRIELSAPGDPVCYLDNLRVWNAVPEPATLSLLALGGLGFLRRRRRRA